MKNKAVLAIIAVLVLGIGGYGVYRVVKHFRRLAGAPQITSLESSGAPSVMKSLKDLLSLGTAQKCTFGQGTVYVASGKVRGDFSSAAEGKTTTTHMISKDNASYIWMDDQKAGYKMSFDLSAQTTPGTTSNQTGSAGTPDFSKPANYNCGAWTVDTSLFDLPKGVTFQDFSSLLHSGAPVPTPTPAGY